MGTSNWQNIPFCIDALMKIEPRRVLDIGVGFGRWGMITREFCDVWFDRVLPHEWAVHIEGVEGFADNIAGYHTYFYNHVHVGDARTILPGLPSGWDVVIFGDVLEHFQRDEAEHLLSWALDNAAYVLVNIPLGSEWPQEDKYSNPYERHLSEWTANDFVQFALRRKALFIDFIDRPFGSFILSRHDAKGLAQSLFTRSSALPVAADVQQSVSGALAPLQQYVLDSAAAMGAELRYLRTRLREIESSRGVRLLNKFQSSPLAQPAKRVVRAVLPDEGGVVRALVRRDPSIITRPVARRFKLPLLPPRANHAQVRVPYRRNLASQGCQTWLLAVNPQATSPFDMQQLRTSAGWKVLPNANTPSGVCLMLDDAGFLDIPTSAETRLLFMTHAWSGKIEIVWRGRSEQIDLYSPEIGALAVHFEPKSGRVLQWREPALGSLSRARSALGQGMSAPVAPQANNHQPHMPSRARAFSTDEQVWLERMVADQPDAIAVMHPEWRGVRSSTVELFPHHRFVDDELDAERGTHEARLLLETGCDHIVLSGFPHTYVHLVNALHRLAPRVKIMDLWYGTFLQSSEEYAWQGFRTVEQLCREGVIYKWGFAKRGMAEVMSAAGLHTGFVMSRVNRVPDGVSTPLPGGPHIGIWAAEANWRKSPYAMLAANRLIPSAHVYGSSMPARAVEFAQLLGLQTTLQDVPVPLAQMPQQLAQMHLNLYVTFSECAPMLPLESLAVGVPCLFGPNSYYFEDHDYLHDRLVVPEPDSALMVARWAQRALEERGAIIEAYAAYAPGYNQRVQRALEAFLELPPRETSHTDSYVNGVVARG